MARRKIVTGDCESWPFKHGRIPKPLIWCIFDGDEFHLFETAGEMVDFLRDKKWIVYFHNGGKFDYFFMLEYMEDFSKILEINGRLAKFKIGECEFRDSYNIIPQPLSAYKKDNFDYTKLEPDVWQKYIREIKQYLQNDCLFLYELIKAYIDEYGVNITLASGAFKFFNKQFAPKKCENTKAAFYDKFKPYYYGGRVECFQKGIIDFPVKCFDINSAYPYAMLHDHPYGTTIINYDYIPENCERDFIEFYGVSKGALPFREENKSLTFPNDNNPRRYFCTGWELLAGLEHGDIEIIKVIKVQRFLERINFKDYVYYFYEKKNNAEKGSAEYIISKLFLNSLYGKYAADSRKYKDTFICQPQYTEHACELFDADYAGNLGCWSLLQRPLAEENQRYYNVATAASITGFVRAYLYKSMKKCKGVVYCDTDSIFCKDANLQIGEELGQWDIEGKFSGGGIGGKKLYAFKFIKPKKDKKYKYASKGAKLEPEQILNVCRGNTVLYKNHAPTFSIKKDTIFLEREIKMT